MWYILTLFFGIIIGCIITTKIHKSEQRKTFENRLVGTLKFLEDEENGSPYLFVDLDVNPNEFMYTQEFVIMNIDNQAMNSQK